MDYKPLPIGIDDFEMLVTRGYYFVDKTMLVKELLDKKGSVNLLTRPRRFGKTLNMSMLQYFFEDMRNDAGEKRDNSHLFEGLRIMDAGERYLSHMGQYPVISLTLKSGKQPDFHMAYESLVDEIIKEYIRHRCVLELDCLTEEYRKRYDDIMNRRADRIAYAKSLAFLSECLERYYGKKAIILIDEYDVPLENAFFSGFYDQMVAFIRSLFESALKTNASLEFAVVTGCLRISKESIFTGLNNLSVFSILSRQCDEYFGFTDAETRKICDDYGMPQKFETVRDWYDGYLFGGTEVYNPWSVVRYIADLREYLDEYPKAYWANTSSNSIVRELVEGADSGAKGEIEQLIEGGTIEKPVHEEITYGDIHENEENLWNFLLFTGYLKVVSRRFEVNTVYLTMTIPNEEVKYIYQNTILTWFTREVRRADYTDLYRALVGGEPGKVQEILKGQLRKCISYFDNSEAFYHGFLLGTLGGIPDYLVKSNRESGNGRPDVLLVPQDERQPVIVIELKTARSFPQMEAGCVEALRQIEELDYAAELLEEGYGKFLRYGICFCKKSCMVRARP